MSRCALINACVEYCSGKFNDAKLTRALKAVPQSERKSPLYLAARDVLKGGRHDGPCRFDLSEGGCSVHVNNSRHRYEVFLALTEQASGLSREVGA